MKLNNFFSFSFSLLLLAVIVSGEEVDKRKKHNETTTSPLNTTTSQASTATANVTITVVPSGNTTISPPTSSAPISTTTVKPASTTAAPTAGDYIGYDSNNRTCIRLHADIKIAIPYLTKDNKTIIAHVEVPFDADVDEVCQNDKQEIRLLWGKIDSNTSSSFVLRFVKDNSTKKYSLVLVVAEILTSDSKVFPNITGNITLFKLDTAETVFSTPLNTSYTCSNLSGIKLNNTLNQTALVQFADLQVEAYGLNKTAKVYTFDSALDCESTPTPSTPDIVPIVVGCALALLVIIVLIAYLISRRRSQARGYLSM